MSVDEERGRRTARSASRAWAGDTPVQQRGRPDLPAFTTNLLQPVYSYPPRTLPPQRYDERARPLPLAGRCLFVPAADPDGSDGFNLWEIIDLAGERLLRWDMLRHRERFSRADAKGVVLAQGGALGFLDIERFRMPNTSWRDPLATCSAEASDR